MIAYGTHEAEEYLVKSGQMEKSEIYRVWNVLEPTEVTPDTGKTIIIILFMTKEQLEFSLKAFLATTATQIL